MNKFFWIADDDPDDRMIIKEAFEENAYDKGLTFFEDGEKVLLKIKGEPKTDLPSLFILDLNMPKVNGLELLSSLKENTITKDIPVVIFSTSRNNIDRDKVLKLGADDFITKPFSFQTMIQITRDLIEKYG
jgi:CheY-like chemotaxis protein